MSSAEPPDRDSTRLDTSVGPDAARATRSPALFVLVEGSRPLVGGARVSLHGVTEVAIGRGADRTATRAAGSSVLTLTFASPFLSGRHARLVRSPEGWTVEDLQSRNGTLVNSRLVSSALLQPGDVVDVGRVFLAVEEVITEGDDGPGNLDASDVSRERPGLLTLVPELESRFADLRRIAKQDVPVTLVGETGTGKEVLAAAVHGLSARKGPYVAINCGAVPANLIESQLFGHVRGAFSGAAAPATGSIRAADGGTLLLDEIVSTSPDVQVALLRAIQEREVNPVGTHQAVPVDVRFVAATQIPLAEAVARRSFRPDLQMRLEGYVFRIPALRERRFDTGILIASILRRRGVTEADGATLTPNAILRVLRHSWPGNIRELEQALARSWVLAKGGEIDQTHFPEPGPAATTDDPHADGDKVLREELIEHLRITGGNVSEASRRMGRARPLVHRWIKRLGIDPDAYRR